jgi:hypothetical protein
MDKAGSRWRAVSRRRRGIEVLFVGPMKYERREEVLNESDGGYSKPSNQ